ncbi:hypothetical protein KY290_032149 [Solanum tuberosum]|uniref:Uncharacterized protein n=1 Tax=Solanum tuberosum TaxID=4113 RepID=A0ABQ7UBE6_SOLTU|nr:hypothetical protein KY290_032149 [Solanum tuberosum]
MKEDIEENVGKDDGKSVKEEQREDQEEMSLNEVYDVKFPPDHQNLNPLRCTMEDDHRTSGEDT